MHICFVTREFPPNLMGGIGTYVENMTRLLADAGHRVTLLTKSHPEARGHGLQQPVKWEGRDNFTVYYLPYVDETWYMEQEVINHTTHSLAQKDIATVFAWQVAEALEHILSGNGTDSGEPVSLIEAPEYEAPLALFQARKKALPSGHPWQRIPCVIHLHSPSHMIFEHNDEDFISPWVRYRKRQEAWSIQMADAVLCPSQYLADQVREWTDIPHESLTVIPYPIGDLLEMPEDIKPNPHRALFVGRVEPRKGAFEFVEAAVEAARFSPLFEFRFVGGEHVRSTGDNNEPTEDLIKAMIPAAVKDQFVFKGRIPRAQLGREYAEALFTVVPSRWDNYPNTCMEAMSCGRPVLASDRGGMAEMLEHGRSGLIAQCTEGNRRGLASALKKTLIEAMQIPPERFHEMGKRARERILSICDDTEITNRHLDYYETLVDRLSRAHPSSFLNIAHTPEKTSHALVNQEERQKQVTENSGDEGREQDVVSVGIGLFCNSLDHPNLEAVITAINNQTLPARRKVIAFRDSDTPSGKLDKSLLKNWELFHAHPRKFPFPKEGLPKGFWSQVVAAKEAATCDMWHFCDPTGVPVATAFEKAANVFLNSQETGFILSWSQREGDPLMDIPTASDSMSILLNDRSSPFAFYATEAFQTAGGLEVNGFYFDHVLIDLQLRLVGAGFRGAVIPEQLVYYSYLSETEEPLSYPCVREFGFLSRDDSAAQIMKSNTGLIASRSREIAYQLVSQWR